MPDEWEMIGFCPVDSGQIMLVDPCYVLADNNTKDEKLNQFYRDICEVTLSSEQAGPWELGCATSTGWGDGSYPVYVKREGGRVAEVRIVFMS
tara:strand:- start:922 stop:1200 length:279 start_codon:yes stop_codon:yes gene_type:complete